MTIPAYKPKKEPTEGQTATRERFADAAAYAMEALQDAEMLAAYTAKAGRGKIPYIVAVTDFLKPPQVKSIDTSDYEGNPGDKILIEARDDFAVKSVEVCIISSAGEKIEKGEAALNMLNSRFEYTATVSVPELDGVTITATAEDYPKHKAERSITL